ncbi:MAG: glycerol-3-phosphate acyltransferase [Ignavibacteriales bacterium]|nr:glycerol-3-phosphate acyltransferase [Ignavibacteriales bacterium]
MSLLYFLTFISGYVVGSIPTAYLIVKRQNNIDIRQAGSGNVGGFNAAQVTQSKFVGILVGILDGFKGLLVVLVAAKITPDEFWVPAIALLSAIAGHNYSIWLKFKGGRGLATAAGGMFFVGFTYTIVWCTLWTIGKFAKRDILTSNLLAIFFTPLVLTIVPWSIVSKAIVVKVESGAFLVFTCMVSVLLTLSHIDAIKQIWKAPAMKKTSIEK